MKNISENKIRQAQNRFDFLGKITARSQFGGYGLLANGIMFSVVSEGSCIYVQMTGLKIYFVPEK